MATRIETALLSDEARRLIAHGLQFVSTDRQLDNGTIVLAGTVQGAPVKYTITATGAVLSNRFVAREVHGQYPLDQYRKGLRAAGELLAKRLG